MFFVHNFHKINYNYYMKIVINSHKKGYRALSHLLESMKIPDEFRDFELLVVIGGHFELPNYEIEFDNNITYIRCNHNSIDFTGLIALSELNYFNQEERIFYMHDTCVIGRDFYKKLKEIDLTNISTMRIHKNSSMNMGIYSQKIISQFKNFLLDNKNTEESKCMEYKYKGISNEDFIFLNDPNTFTIGDWNGWIHTDPIDYYKTGTMRVVEYHPHLDMYKIKANCNCDNVTLDN